MDERETNQQRIREGMCAMCLCIHEYVWVCLSANVDNLISLHEIILFNEQRKTTGAREGERARELVPKAYAMHWRLWASCAGRTWIYLSRRKLKRLGYPWMLYSFIQHTTENTHTTVTKCRRFSDWGTCAKVCASGDLCFNIYTNSHLHTVNTHTNTFNALILVVG